MRWVFHTHCFRKVVVSVWLRNSIFSVNLELIRDTWTRSWSLRKAYSTPVESSTNMMQVSGMKRTYVLLQKYHRPYKKDLVWSVMLKAKIVGTYFFSESASSDENFIKRLRYCDMYRLLDLPTSSIFQQDRASSWLSLSVISYLHRRLSKRWVGRGV